MKRVVNYILLLLFVLLLIDCNLVNASVKTYERTEYDLGIADDIKVTEENKQNILSTPKVDETEKVYDFADLFTLEEEKYLYDKIQDYIDKRDMDMAIVTIKENNKITPEVYADDFYDYNNFGINNSHDGVLLLIDMDNRYIHMSTTGKAINKYNDSRIDQILDSVYEYMASEDYFNAAIAFIDEISSNASNIPWGLIFITPIIVATIPTVIFIFKNKMVRKGIEANRYMERNSLNITNTKDVFVTTHTVKHAKVDSSSGSSTHIGSSGRSHGGGGRSF